MSFSLTRNGKPPVVTLTREDFERRLNALVDAADAIHPHPDQYTPAVAAKAERVADTVDRFGSCEDDDAQTKYLAYRLGQHDAALLRTQAGSALLDHVGAWADPELENKFGQSRKVTSIIDVLVAHPLATNGGDSLIQHVLNQDGPDALLLATTVTSEAAQRYRQMGFETLPGDANTSHVLDARRQNSVWTKDVDGNFVRAGKPNQFLLHDSASESNLL